MRAGAAFGDAGGDGYDGAEGPWFAPPLGLLQPWLEPALGRVARLPPAPAGSPHVDLSVDTDGIARLVSTSAAWDTADGGGLFLQLPAALDFQAAAAVSSSSASPLASASAPAVQRQRQAKGCGQQRQKQQQQQCARQPLATAAHAQRTGAVSAISGESALAVYGPGADLPQTGPELPPETLRHGSTDELGLGARLQQALEKARQASEQEGSAAKPAVVVDLVDNCAELTSLEITSGEVVLRGALCAEGASRTKLMLAGLRVTGGASLSLSHLELLVAEDIRVEAARLSCEDCSLRSQGGCGVLCLQRAQLTLRDCQVHRSLRSGIGVNGKNAELDIQRCRIVGNGFSGVGVNQKCRSITLSGNTISGNAVNAIWLNCGVVAHCHGCDLSSNKLGPKGGPGVLHVYELELECRDEQFSGDA